MPRTRGKSGDFHKGVPDKHVGKKGDTTHDIRSSSQLRRAQKGHLKNLSPDAKDYLESMNNIETSEEGISEVSKT